MNPTRRIQVAFFARGPIAIGVVAIGGVAVGVVAIGAVALGVVAIGAVAVGGFAVGAFALGFKKVAALTAITGACAAGMRMRRDRGLLDSPP